MSVDVRSARAASVFVWQEVRDWLKRCGFRWLMLYVVLYVALEPFVSGICAFISGLPLFGWISFAQSNLAQAVVPWVGNHFLGQTIRVIPNEGERLLEYLQDGLIAVLALVAAVVWTCIDRNSTRERALYEFTHSLARYTLAIVLFFYGIPKFFPCGFFPCLEPAQLMAPFGDLTPTTLMWFFFGASSGYSIFIGLGEVVGAGLVLFRRTATIGAAVLAGVMINVLMVNISYNTDVRRPAANLALMAIFVLASDARRIIRVMLGYAVEANSWIKTTPNVWRTAGGTIAKVAIIGWIVLHFIPSWRQVADANRAAQHVPMNGYYSVRNFREHETRTAAPGVPASTWQMVSIEGNYYFTREEGNVHLASIYDILHVRTTASEVQNYLLKIQHRDATHGLFSLTHCPDYDHHCRLVVQTSASPTSIAKVRTKPIVLRYVVVAGSSQGTNKDFRYTNTLMLNGTMDHAQVSMELDHFAQSPFKLERSGMQLIDPNDYLWDL